MSSQLNSFESTTSQKIGIFIFIALGLLVIFLHFPFSGYKTQYSYTVDTHSIVVSPECKEFNKMQLADLNKLTQSDLDIAFNLNKKCADEWNKQLTRIVELPFSEWSSNEPIVAWFGNVIHTLALLIFVVILGSLWLWTFRSKNDR